MAIDLGNAPTGTPPTSGEKLQIRTAIGLINTQTVGNADATIASGTVDVILTAALTLPRTYTLPLASAYPAGARLSFSDSAATLTAVNSATLTRAGSDLINGATTVVLVTSGAAPILISDGTSRWTLDIRGVSRGGTGATTVAGARTNLGLGTTDSPTFLSLAVAGQSVTGAATTPLLDLAATWNTTGIVTALKLNVTDTASPLSSLLMDLQVGGASIISADKAGVFGVVGFVLGTRSSFGVAGNNWWSNNSLNLGPSTALKWNTDTSLFRGAANTLFQRNGVNAQNYWIANTYTDASNYERAVLGFTGNVLRIGTEMLGTGVARELAFVVGGVARVNVGAAGMIGSGYIQATTYLQAIQQVEAGAASYIGWTNRSTMHAPGVGIICLGNWATPATDFNRLQFGGTTSSFPALKRSTTSLQVRLADDTADADISAANLVSGTVGKGLQIKGGSILARAGNAVLVAGTVTVANTTATANTVILLTRKTSGGTIGTAVNYSVSAGTSFTITSDSALDTSTYSFLMVEVN